MNKLYKHIVKAEIIDQVTKPLFFVFVLIAFLLAVNDITMTSPTASGLTRIGELHHNSSLVISRLLAVISVMSIIFTPFIISQALQKDFDNNFHGIIYSYPVTNSEYLWGRFWGAFLVFLIIPLASLIGAGFGNLTLSEEFLGPLNLGAYVWSFLLIVLPGLLFSSLLLYLVTIKTRKKSSIYLTTIILFLLLFIIQALLGDQLRYVSEEKLQGLKWLTILDPFGISTLDVVSREMSVDGKNEFTLISNSFLLIHRLCWLLISFGLLIIVHKTFNRTFLFEKMGKKKRKKSTQIFKSVRKLVSLPVVMISHSLVSRLKCLFRLSWVDFKYVVFNIGFIIITMLSLSSLHSNFNKNIESSGLYPTTAYFINSGMDNVDMPILLLLLFFAGVIIWKEKDNKFDTILYSYPLPNTFIFIQKLVSLFMIVVFYFIIVFAFGVFTQFVLYDFEDISFNAYWQYLAGYSIFKYLVVATGFSILHVLSPNKFIGYGLSVLAVLFVLLSPSMGIETYLIRPGTLPEVAYSHLNELNPVETINFWYRIYWVCFIGIVCMVAFIIWDRGEGQGLMKRLSKGDFKLKIGTLVLILAFVAIGSFIAVNSGMFQKTNTELYTYLQYEKKYRQYEKLEQPAIDDVSLNVDLYPSQRSGLIEGTYRLVNNSNEPIDAVHVTLISTDVTDLKEIKFNTEGTYQIWDEQIGYYLYSLDTPLQPGENISFSYELIFDENEYKDHDFNLDLVENGMILNSWVGEVSYFPQIGYKRELEVQNEELRAAQGLIPEPSTLILLADTTQTRRASRDMISYEATISTEHEQTAISTGYLVKAWQEGDRNYFKYKSHRPISGEFGIVSGRYKKHTEIRDELTINIFYDEKHHYNLKSITEGIVNSYNFNEDNFESYGHPSINIVEVPGYGVVNGTAMSKPTLILWNENGGFTANVKRMYIDRVYSTAVHEMAHQWWGHRLRPVSFTEGQQLMYETIAQYVRLVALDKKYNETTVRKFLDEEKYKYNIGAMQSMEEDQPLLTTSKGHIIYNKGTVAMDSLKTLLGEEKLNKILSDFYSEYTLGNTRPVSTDFVEVFRTQAPDSIKESIIHILTKPGL